MAKREAKRVAFPNAVDLPKSIRPEQPQKREKEIVLEERTLTVDPQTKKVTKSFFDEIG